MTMSETLRPLPCPYWWESAGPPTCPAPSQLPKTIDLAVIGAGLTGLSAARVAAQAGRSVLVFDARAPGEGAASRYGGMIGGGHRLSIAQMHAQFGEKTGTELLFEAHCASRAHALQVMQDEAIDCDYAETGRFRGLWRTDEYDNAARGLDQLKKLIPLDAYMVPKTDQQAEAGTNLYAGGTVYPCHGGLNPAKWVKGLLSAADRAGAGVKRFLPDQLSQLGLP